MAASTLLASSKAEEPQTVAILEPHTGVASSKRVVVAYAVADTNRSTNMTFTITQIWKGSEEGSALGITNGTQIRYQYPNGSTAYLPDAAIVTITQDFSPSDTQAITFGPGIGMDFVRQGKVEGMTVQEFKKKRMGL